MNVKKNPFYYINTVFFLVLTIYSLLVCIRIFEPDNIDMNAGLCAVIVSMVLCLIMYLIYATRVSNMLYSNPILKTALEVISVLIFLTLSCVVRVYMMGEFELDITREGIVLLCMFMAYLTARMLNQFGFVTLMLLVPWPYLISTYNYDMEQLMRMASVIAGICILSVLIFAVRKKQKLRLVAMVLFLIAVMAFFYYEMYQAGITSVYMENYKKYIECFNRMFEFTQFEQYYFIVLVMAAIIGGIRLFLGSGSANTLILFAVNAVCFFTVTFNLGTMYLNFMYPLLAMAAAGALGTRPSYMDEEVQLKDNLENVQVKYNNKDVVGVSYVDESELDRMLADIEGSAQYSTHKRFSTAQHGEDESSNEDIPIELLMYDSASSKLEEETVTPAPQPTAPAPVYEPVAPAPTYEPAPQPAVTAPIYEPVAPPPMYEPAPQPTVPAPVYEPAPQPAAPAPVYEPVAPPPMYEPAPQPVAPAPIYEPVAPTPVYEPTAPTPTYEPMTPPPAYEPAAPAPSYKTIEEPKQPTYEPEYHYEEEKPTYEPEYHYEEEKPTYEPEYHYIGEPAPVEEPVPEPYSSYSEPKPVYEPEVPVTQPEAPAPTYEPEYHYEEEKPTYEPEYHYKEETEPVEEPIPEPYSSYSEPEPVYEPEVSVTQPEVTAPVYEQEAPAPTYEPEYHYEEEKPTYEPEYHYEEETAPVEEPIPEPYSSYSEPEPVYEPVTPAPQPEASVPVYEPEVPVAQPEVTAPTYEQEAPAPTYEPEYQYEEEKPAYEPEYHYEEEKPTYEPEYHYEEETASVEEPIPEPYSSYSEPEPVYEPVTPAPQPEASVPVYEPEVPVAQPEVAAPTYEPEVPVAQPEAAAPVYEQAVSAPTYEPVTPAPQMEASAPTEEPASSAPVYETVEETKQPANEPEVPVEQPAAAKPMFETMASFFSNGMNEAPKFEMSLQDAQSFNAYSAANEIYTPIDSLDELYTNADAGLAFEEVAAEKQAAPVQTASAQQIQGEKPYNEDDELVEEPVSIRRDSRVEDLFELNTGNGASLNSHFQNSQSANMPEFDFTDVIAPVVLDKSVDDDEEAVVETANQQTVQQTVVEPETVELGLDLGEEFGFGQMQSFTDFYDNDTDSTPAFAAFEEVQEVSEPVFTGVDAAATVSEASPVEISVPVMETPIMQTPVMETPVMKTPAPETFVTEAPVMQEPVNEMPLVKAAETEVETVNTVPEPVYVEPVQNNVVNMPPTAAPEVPAAPEVEKKEKEPVKTVNPFAKEADFFDWSTYDGSVEEEAVPVVEETANEPVKASEGNEFDVFVWTDEMVKEFSQGPETAVAEVIEEIAATAVPDPVFEPVPEIKVEAPVQEFKIETPAPEFKVEIPAPVNVIEEPVRQDTIKEVVREEAVVKREVTPEAAVDEEETPQYQVFQSSGSFRLEEPEVEEAAPQYQVFQSSGNFRLDEPEKEEEEAAPQYKVFQSSGSFHMEEEEEEEAAPMLKTYGGPEPEPKQPVETKPASANKFADLEFDLDLPDFEPFDATKR